MKKNIIGYVCFGEVNTPIERLQMKHDEALAAAADVVLKQHVNRETDKWNAQGTTSTTALCMIFHALQAAVIEQTGYQAEQFALIHPGGAVGERLNNKAL